MLNRSLAVAALAAAVLLAATGPAGAASALSDDRGTKRVLLVFAPRADDGRLAAQRAIFASMREGAAERDLVLVTAIGDQPGARALRAAHGLGPDAFRVVLVGKDGGAKLGADEPLGPDQLFPLIDAMPMRQDEMRRRP